jgi:6-phosphogluconolactonase (cycloisomerase 2 family)
MSTIPHSRTGAWFLSTLAAVVRPRAALLATLVGVTAACDTADTAESLTEPVAFAAATAGRGSARGVYTMTNDASNNEILVFPRNADGTIGTPTAVPTGGAGSGGGLGSQGAVVLSDDNRWLLAVNAGSNELSVFEVRRAQITLTDRIDSGGEMPVSVAIYGNFVYVVNAGTPNNVTAFRLNLRGGLTPIPFSTRPLSAPSTAPAQVSVTNNGRRLVVTEKATNLITTYRIDPATGRPGSPHFVESEGQTPFGFAFDRRGRMHVSEAFGGAPGGSALSSYARLTFTPISSSVGSGEQAACWVVISDQRPLAFVTNTGSGSISTYRIASDGSVSLLHAVAASTGAGSGPIDMALSDDGQFLFVLAPGNGTVRPYAINADGTLTGLGPISGVPGTAFGLAAF